MFSRRFLIALWLAAMGSWGCTEQSKIQSANIQVVRKLNLYLNQHNWQAMHYCYADTVQRKDSSNSHHTYLLTKGDCIGRYRLLQEQTPNFKQRITQLYASGGHHVVMETIIEGTTPSGTVLRQEGCIIYTIERQRITKEYRYESLLTPNLSLHN
jgi:hypothetical protein